MLRKKVYVLRDNFYVLRDNFYVAARCSTVCGLRGGGWMAWAEKTQTRLYRVAVQPRGVLSMSVTGRGGRGLSGAGRALTLTRRD